MTNTNVYEECTIVYYEKLRTKNIMNQNVLFVENCFFLKKIVILKFLVTDLAKY